ncbi:MAG: dihydrofolate reductase [Verrucomicrobiota bacterium]
MKPVLTAIVAMDPQRLIGAKGQLPWHLPEDLKFFKRTTSGHALLMGRKTFDSIGRPLPKRRNLVLTRDPTWSAPGVEVLHQLSQLPPIRPEERLFLIGGAELYSQLLQHCRELLITHVKEEYRGDTWFPSYQDRFAKTEILQETADFEIARWERRGTDPKSTGPLSSARQRLS